MPYTCHLPSGQQLFLENAGNATIVTMASTGVGQQQQASSRLQTGVWAGPPQVFQTANGVVVRIATIQGTHYLQIQGNQISTINGPPGIDQLTTVGMTQVAAIPGPSMPPMPPMQPMQPMPPMQMGNMTLTTDPMEMRMGNMAMQMGASNPPSPQNPPGQRRFCTQCGAQVAPEDRFCGSCGHQLQSGG